MRFALPSALLANFLVSATYAAPIYKDDSLRCELGALRAQRLWSADPKRRVGELQATISEQLERIQMSGSTLRKGREVCADDSTCVAALRPAERNLSALKGEHARMDDTLTLLRTAFPVSQAPSRKALKSSSDSMCASDPRSQACLSSVEGWSTTWAAEVERGRLADQYSYDRKCLEWVRSGRLKAPASWPRVVTGQESIIRDAMQAGHKLASPPTGKPHANAVFRIAQAAYRCGFPRESVALLSSVSDGAFSWPQGPFQKHSLMGRGWIAIGRPDSSLKEFDRAGIPDSLERKSDWDLRISPDLVLEYVRARWEMLGSDEANNYLALWGERPNADPALVDFLLGPPRWKVGKPRKK